MDGKREPTSFFVQIFIYYNIFLNTPGSFDSNTFTPGTLHLI